MAKTRKDLRILLMQIREDPRVAEEELNSFARHADLDLSQFTILNVFETPDFDHSVLEGFDSLWVGGASEANVLLPEEFPFIASATRLLKHCYDINMPVFASCFGFQLAVLALEGEVVDSVGEFEMGCIPISLTEAGRQDILFHDTPDQFLAVSVHRQKALELPSVCTLLAFTDVCTHAFRAGDRNFWAFQFHPEVDRQILVERLTIYMDCYTQGNDHLQSVLENAVETPESNILMLKFVDRVLLAG